MRILIVGDVHGLFGEFHDFVLHARREMRVGAVIQVGDFGFFPEIVEGALASGLSFPVPVYAVDGNHEDHRWLSFAVQDGSVREWQRVMNLYFMDRGTVASIGGTRVGFLGGALHVDRPQVFDAAMGTSNYIQREQRVRAADVFNRERPDVIVSHTCPTGIGIGIRGSPVFAPGVAAYIAAAGFDPGVDGDCGDIELTRLWRAMEYRPRAWVFGHFHADHRALVEGTDFVCLGGMDPDSIAMWDTDDGQILVLKTPSAGRP